MITPASPFARFGRARAWPLLVLLVGTFGVLGCDRKAGQPGFKVHNKSGEDLRHLIITDAGPVLNYSRLEDGEKLLRKLPGNEAALPRTINVYWKCLEGESHHQRIELWKRISSNYNGTVKLTLERNGSIRVSKALRT